MGVKVEQIKKKPNTRPAQHSSRIFSGRAGRGDQGWINKRCPREMRLSDTRWVIGSITTLLPVLAATNFIITTDELQPHSATTIRSRVCSHTLKTLTFLRRLEVNPSFTRMNGG